MGRKKKNYYEILEVPTNADPKDLRHSYIRAKNTYSQDSPALYSLMNREECDAILESIEEAYIVLSDPLKRKEYDSAHGMNRGVNFQIPRKGGRKEEENSFSYMNVGEQSVPKIVFTKKFALDYTVDPQFEEEIDQTVEFSGEFLKKIREYKNVDMVRMSELTRVSKTYLRYIEAEEFDKLPAPVYVRGFIFQYAKCLKLNHDLVATSYLHRLKQDS